MTRMKDSRPLLVVIVVDAIRGYFHVTGHQRRHVEDRFDRFVNDLVQSGLSPPLIIHSLSYILIIIVVVLGFILILPLDRL